MFLNYSNKSKELLSYLTVILLSATFSLSSCSKDEKKSDLSTIYESYIDATSAQIWIYFSFSNNRVVGEGDDTQESIDQWSNRGDWDIALRRYNLKTNSGLSTKIGAKGGVYTFDSKTEFVSINKTPSSASYEADKEIITVGMGGESRIVMSSAVSVLFKKDSDGQMIMPPVYIKPPVYLFRDATGERFYKVEFIQYLDDSNKTGHIKFKWQEIYKD